MALVCDTKSEDAVNDDLEDGEIEDDDEPEGEPPSAEAPAAKPAAESPEDPKAQKPDKAARFERERRPKHDEKKRSTHLTEAEKSVMYLHKLERLEREKRDRYRRDQGKVAVDDFASTVEKAIASVLKKERSTSDEEKEEEKRGKKRKKKDKDRKKSKQRKLDSPKSDEVEEGEMLCVRGASPPEKVAIEPSPSVHSDDEESVDSESSEKKRERRKNPKARNRERRERKYREAREKRTEAALKDSPNVCVFYMQGKCHKGEECPYSHEVLPPMKLELCKFYLMDCCAKGEKCLYMHSEFPCKFYHTGLPCYAGDNCKFAHGKPLSEGLKQILFKHLETAPKEILGDFPRLTRDGALNMINQTQKGLEVKYGVEKKDGPDGIKSNIPSLFDISVPMPPELIQKDDGKNKDKSDKPAGGRVRPSRWQDPDPDAPDQKLSLNFPNFYSERDQDMRVNSNGDIDMRTLPPQFAPLNSTQDEDFEGFKEDVDIRQETMSKDVDQRQLDASKDVDIRQFPPVTKAESEDAESNLEIVTDEDNSEVRKEDVASPEAEQVDELMDEFPASLPKRQKELFLRIQAQQKDNVPEKDGSDNEDSAAIDWYSDDDDDNRLTIKDDEEVKEKMEEEKAVLSPPAVKPVDGLMEKLGDLSKIDISAEVTKLLSTISSGNLLTPKDPRTVEPKPVLADPRRARLTSTEKPIDKPKVSIYEQGSISIDAKRDIDLRIEKDMDLRPAFGDMDLRGGSGRPDVDLRQLNLPFKAIQNYTPATEIDATIGSHSPIFWRVHIVDVPRPDYTGLKLSVQDAQSTGDPRLRKIFRLSTEEKDSPASPKESPKAPTGIRADPRRRKMEENKADPTQLSYVQQLNMLQSSPFYQNLTSNQKVMLNQELASRADQTGTNDPIIAGILTNLGLTPGVSKMGTANSSAVSILASVNNMTAALMGQMPLNQNPNMLAQMGPNPNMMAGGPNQNFGPAVNPNILAQNPNILNQMAQSVVQPGLLGAAPGVPNLPPDFQLNFDPRNGGLLGNAPFPNYPDNGNYNYNDDYYEGNHFNNSNNRNERGYNRDRPQRRGRNFNNRNNGRNNFRNRNRSNRSHTPP